MKGIVQFIVLLGILCPTLLSGKEIKYKVADIPKELKENARSVLRKEVIEFEIKSPGAAVLRVTYAVTILNKNGLNDSYLVLQYGKFNKISGISGRVFDENGEQIKKLYGDDILDYSAISGYSMYEDSRVKAIDPKVLTIPFTVEYTYEENFNGLFYYPTWDPVRKYNFSVEQSSFKAVVPKGMEFRYLEKNLPSKVVIDVGQVTSYSWQVNNIKAYIKEPFDYDYREVMPVVFMAPKSFEIDSYKGDLTSWKTFGDWINTLNDKRNLLPEATQAKLNELVKDLKTDREKVKAVYEFMQGKTRYVSIQIGIGGWQPFEAATVDRLSYGDCKALTNYMKSMLDFIGIRSNYCIVEAGEDAHDMIKDFPSSQFNHAFLCVPVEKDTIWLECTSQRMPCGYIGDFTDDRDVLLIDKDNSKIVHTKAYTAKDNQEIRKTIVHLDAGGNGNAVVSTLYKGLNYDQILPIFIADDADKKRKISNRIHLPNFQLKNFSYKENREIIPSFEETLHIDFSAYGTQMPPRMFFPVNFMNRYNNIPERVRNRKTDVYIRRPFVEIDTVVYNISDFLKVENIPNPVSIESKFGKYSAKTEIVESKIVYSRYFEIRKGKYPPVAYSEFLEFLEKVSTADGSQCSLIKK
jgi:hypothetical protein